MTFAHAQAATPSHPHQSLGVFGRFAKRVAAASGHPLAFLAAAALVVGWALTGPVFGFGETWQLVINTTTTIFTFLMVFLIQNTQNRDLSALHVKLDELVRVTRAASNAVLAAEEDENVSQLEEQYERLADQLDDAPLAPISTPERELTMKRPNKPADSQSKLDRRKTTTTRRGPNEDLDRQRRANTNDRDEVRQHTTHRQGHPK